MRFSELEKNEAYIRNSTIAMGRGAVSPDSTAKGRLRTALYSGISLFALVCATTGIARMMEHAATTHDEAHRHTHVQADAGHSHPDDSRSLPVPDGQRGLTAREAHLSQALLGDDFNTETVQLKFYDDFPIETLHHDLPPEFMVLAFVRGGGTRDIHIVAPTLQTDDFTKGFSPVFAHEMVHIWQNRMNITYAPDCDDTRDYSATSASFGQMCKEPQAYLLGDYASRFLMPAHPALADQAKHAAILTLNGMPAPDMTSAHDRVLIEKVETAFPALARHRQALQMQFNDASLCAFGQSMTTDVSYEAAFETCAAQYIVTQDGTPALPAQTAPRTQTAQLQQVPAQAPAPRGPRNG